jgi:hypothetical protein
MAVIVGSPGHPIEAPPLLVGVKADAVSYERFFLSNHGGAWEPGEIRQVWHPERDALGAFLGSLYVDYSVTVFCGHGWRQDGEAVILVRPHEPIWVSRFRTQAPRQLTIIDACQVEEEPKYLLKEGQPSVGFGADGGRDTYRDTCRALYDNAVSTVGEQRTIMYGCKLGQEAGENPLGGYFSQTLLNASTAWARTAQRTAIASQVLSVRDAFAIAAPLVTQRHYPQEPQLESGRGRAAFPFAVA